jgi:hypothetical protein
MKATTVQTLLAAALLTCFIGCSKEVDNLNTTPAGVPEIPAVSLWPGMTSVDVRPVFPQELSTAKPIHAVMDVESLVYRALTVQYRVQWLDAQGKILNPDGDFKIINMAPRTQTRLDLTDPHATAVSWRAEFRPAR